MRSWFDTIDSTARQSEPAYSPAVAGQLRHARRVLVRAPLRLDAYAVVFQRLSPLRAISMSLHQRLRVEYLMAMCFAALDEYTFALHCLGDVRELALRLDEVDAQADGDYLAGAIYQRQGHYGAAVEAYECAMAALRQRPATSAVPADIPFELSVLNACAFMNFLIGHYDVAASHVGAARQLLGAAPDAAREAALVAWVTALLQRWQGAPEAAYAQARRAQVLLDSLDDTGAQARIHAVLAEICLDLAESTQEQRDTDWPSGPFTQARPLAQQALTYANQIGDEGGAGLARLALIRHSRLARLNERRVPQIEAVLHQARMRGDQPMMVQSWTALGDEFSTLGEMESAHHCYSGALSALGASDAVAISLPARRALLLEQEWRPASPFDAPESDAP